MIGFRFKVAPWKHQRKALRAAWKRKAFALFMEQGTGKTKVIVDEVGALYLAGELDALIVVAPDGVQRAWVRDAIPEHMSPVVTWRAAWWENKQTKKLTRAIDAVHDRNFTGLRVLTINYETLATKEGFAAVRLFMMAYRCMMVCDESHRIKNPKAKRSEAVYKLSGLAHYRRALTGTPVALSPLDMYGQFLFLDEDVLGSRSFVAFKAHYAVLEGPESHLLRHIQQRLEQKYGVERARRMTPTLIKRDENGMPMYRNIAELNALIKPHSFRVLKEQCLDLPPKLYLRRYVRLNTEQRRVYDELRDDFFTEFGESLMVTPLAITRLTRLQQITGGFFKPHVDAETIPLGSNPKLESLLDAAQEGSGKFLIWARFVAELELIADTLEKDFGKGSVARYWGGASKAQRDKNKSAFVNNPICRFFVAQPKAGGTGLDGLQVADTEIYFSNEMALIDRLQSEDRGHRGGSEIHSCVTIIDIEAEDTLDRKIIEALRAKKNVADAITGDNPKDWL
jgi:SNF2 family DNA or RNA helicase